MRYKKLILGMITSVFCLGFLNGCSTYSCGFNSSKEAQNYVLSKLEDKYKEKFVITEVKNYKEEKIGINWIMAKVSSKADSSKAAIVYARNTGYFKDDYHANYFSGQLKSLANPLFQDKTFIKDCQLEVKGYTTATEWTGKENVEEYLEKKEYEIEADIYLNEGKTDEKYAQEIADIMPDILKSNLNFNISVYVNDNLIFYSLPEEERQPDVDFILEEMADIKSRQETLKHYDEWKKQNQKNETNSE